MPDPEALLLTEAGKPTSARASMGRGTLSGEEAKSALGRRPRGAARVTGEALCSSSAFLILTLPWCPLSSSEQDCPVAGADVTQGCEWPTGMADLGVGIWVVSKALALERERV